MVGFCNQEQRQQRKYLRIGRKDRYGQLLSPSTYTFPRPPPPPLAVASPFTTGLNVRPRTSGFILFRQRSTSATIHAGRKNTAVLMRPSAAGTFNFTHLRECGKLRLGSLSNATGAKTVDKRVTHGTKRMDERTNSTLRNLILLF